MPGYWLPGPKIPTIPKMRFTGKIWCGCEMKWDFKIPFIFLPMLPMIFCRMKSFPISIGWLMRYFSRVSKKVSASRWLKPASRTSLFFVPTFPSFMRSAEKIWAISIRTVIRPLSQRWSMIVWIRKWLFAGQGTPKIITDGNQFIVRWSNH